MAHLAPEDIDDLVAATLPEYDRGKWNQIAQTYQKYEVMSRIMSKKKRKFEGGESIDRTLAVTPSGAAKNVGLFEEDDTNVINHTDAITVPWRFSQTSWTYDVKEKQLNRGAAAIYDEVAVRENLAYDSLAKLMEDDFWGRLAATADNKKIFGVDYWINKTGSATGFNGTDPTGFAGGAGGITVAAVPAWANFSAEYTAVSKPDLIKKWREAFVKTEFMPAKENPNYANGRGRDFSFYCNYETLSEIEDVGESQNDNLGRDIASMDGKMLFRGIPITWVPYLDNDAKDPVYGINWQWFECAIQSGSYMRRTRQTPGNMHDVRRVFIDLTWNTLCTNRRQQFVIEKA